MKAIKSICHALLFLIFFTSLANGEIPSSPWIVKEEFLSQGVTHFDCHSSSIVETSPGHFCTVWKGRPGEGKSNITMAENVGVWISLFDGNTWSPPKEIVSAPDSVCWNPILCKLTSHELILFYRMGPDPRNVVNFIK